MTGLLALVSGFTPVVLAASSFESFQTHSHFAVSADPQVSYRLERVEAGGRLTGLKLYLSALSEEMPSLEREPDGRTSQVRVTSSRGQNGFDAVVEFQFLPRATEAGVEYFDYRDKGTGEIQLDYWTKPVKAEAPKATAAAKAPKLKPAPVKQARAEAKKEAPAPFAGCGKPLVLGQDPFIYFRNYHKPFDYRAYFNLPTADTGYAYPFTGDKGGKVPANRAAEVAHYRLAFKLYGEAQFALVLRTLDFFRAKYPKSDLNAELDFLKASTLIQLSKLLKTDRYLDQAGEVYRGFVLTQAESEKGRRALNYLIQEMMANKRYLFGLEYALRGAELPPAKNSALWVYRLASAEALQAIGELDRAERTYTLIEEQENALAAEGMFRLPEVYTARKFWDRAALAYEKAFREKGKEAIRYPSAWFNLAETYMRLGRYAEAKKAFRDYVERFPVEENLWAAELRLAELEQLSLKKAAPSKNESIHALYEGIINRHPYSPGSMFAQLRLSECHRQIKEDSSRDFYTEFFTKRELKKFETALVDPSEVEVWMDLAEGRYRRTGKDYVGVLARSMEYKDRVGKLELGGAFRKLYAEALLRLVEELSKEHGKAEEVLSAVEKYAFYAPSPAPFGYALGVARAASETKDLKTWNDKLKELETRLADSSDEQKDEFHLLKARYMRLIGANPNQIAVEYTQIRDNGPFVVTRYRELAESATSAGDRNAAVLYDTKLVDGYLAKMTAEQRVASYVRLIENLDRQKESRQENLRRIVRLADQALLRVGTYTQFKKELIRVRELRAQALYSLGEDKAAVAAFHEILQMDPEHPRRTEFEFEMAKSLARLGRENEALTTFRRLAEAAKDNVWKKSAQEELDQRQWENQVGNLNQTKTGGQQ